MHFLTCRSADLILLQSNLRCTAVKLDRAKTKAQADSSPAAEDEQGGPSLVDDE